MEKLLEERSRKIDKIIEKYIPREYAKSSLESTLGKPRYASDIGPANAAISKPIWDLLDRGGKRWRPALFMMVAEALGSDIKKYEDLVAIFEIVHNGSLVSDDVEDSSELRRGKPCIHKAYGIDVAVNVGSAMYFLPMQALMRSKIDKDKALKIYETYTQELIAIHFGQAMDISWHRGLANANNIGEKEYLQMCAYKTGTLARLSAKVGAIVAGADDKTIEKMGSLAEAIGIGFQIQDDILNLTAVSGKNQFTKDYMGSDITEGKRTLIVIHALSKSTPGEKKRLLEILSSHSSQIAVIEEAITLLKKYDSISYAKRFARDLVSDAWNNSKGLLKDNAAKNELEAFVRFAVERDY